MPDQLCSSIRARAGRGVSLMRAKVSTLDGRVEGTFLTDGVELQQYNAQIAIETQSLDALRA
jgi:hypothetical protein